jgi:hypothetical protein
MRTLPKHDEEHKVLLKLNPLFKKAQAKLAKL